MGSTVKSTARAERMKARWADPELAAKMRANLRRGHAPKPDPAPSPEPTETPPAPPAGGAAPAASPFTGRRILGRHRSSGK